MNYPSLTAIENLQSRNLVRGVLAFSYEKAVNIKIIERLKRTLSVHDLGIAVPVLYGKGGRHPFKNVWPYASQLAASHDLQNFGVSKEIAFIASRVNTWKAEFSSLVDAAISINQNIANKPIDAFRTLLSTASEWGLSNYLLSKVAYIMAGDRIDSSVVECFRQFCVQCRLGHAPMPYFSLYENMDSQIAFFENARNWFLSTDRYNLDDFRLNLTLHNFFPIPLSERDISSFLRRCHSMSIVDEFFALKQLIDDSKEHGRANKLACSILDPDFVDLFKRIDDSEIDWKLLLRNENAESSDMGLYRISGVFLEFPEVFSFRSHVDRRIAHRIVSARYRISFPAILGDVLWKEEKKQLLHRPTGFANCKHLGLPRNDGILLRTVRFLTYLSRYPQRLDFSDHEIKFIFDNTVSLQSFMTEEEINRIYSTATGDSRHLIAALAMALLKNKTNSDDADFSFRHHLQVTIKEVFGGDIVAFIKWLADLTPNVAKYIADMLDRSSLQKFYLLVRSVAEANKVSQDILRFLGSRFNKIDCLVAADRIKVEAKIQSLRYHIDDSRISVDEYSFRKWITDNSVSLIREYNRLIKHSVNRLELPAVQVVDEKTIQSVLLILKPLEAFDHMLVQCAKESFSTFCTNSRFGIESFLGRRIRHNTLMGIMLGEVEAFAQQQRFRPLFYDPEFSEQYREWLEAYKGAIDELRTEYLQFRRPTKRLGLFNEEIDVTNVTFLSSFAKLKYTAVANDGIEQYVEEVLGMCWKLVSPQLDQAMRYIKVDLQRRTVSKIDSVISFDSQNASSFKAELRNVVQAKYDKVSSWFRVPESTGTSATISEICDLVLAECREHYPDIDIRLACGGHAAGETVYGLSVHHVYDCLFVLVVNALRHGDVNRESAIEFSLTRDARAFPKLSVSATSFFRSESDADKQFKSLLDSMNSSEDLNSAMVKEGYSGLRKIKFLLTQLLTDETLTASREKLKLTISFDLRVELDENRNESASR